jgi:hypothetical protein
VQQSFDARIPAARMCIKSFCEHRQKSSSGPRSIQNRCTVFKYAYYHSFNILTYNKETLAYAALDTALPKHYACYMWSLTKKAIS